MKKIHHLCFALLAVLLIAACGKDGSVGPKGDTGSQGQQGMIGPAGPKGADGTAGSVIYSGVTIPPVTTGANGDFYLNTITGLLYGPKTTTGWGAGISLKGTDGATGAAGTAGSQTLSGNGAPAATLGANNDYYLDKSGYLLYGPKTAGNWGTPINLRGPQGPAGPQGPTGNANVKTDIFTLTTDDWIYNDIYWIGILPSVSAGYFSRYYDRNNALITADLLNTGLILVYFQSEPDLNATDWQPMPFSFTPGGKGDFSYNWAYVTTVGKVRLHFYFVKLLSTPPDLSTYKLPTAKFKIITITGTLLSAIKNDHINLDDYNAVSKYTGAWQQDKLQ